MPSRLESIVSGAHILTYFGSQLGLGLDGGWRNLNSFGIHLGFVVSENFTDHDGVVEVSMIEVHIWQVAS